jgi:hypothetical protein
LTGGPTQDIFHCGAGTDTADGQAGTDSFYTYHVEVPRCETIKM